MQQGAYSIQAFLTHTNSLSGHIWDEDVNPDKLIQTLEHLRVGVEETPEVFLC
jgi:hypothetical protein